MKRALAAFVIGFVISVTGLVVLESQTGWNGRLLEHMQADRQVSLNAGGKDFDCGNAELSLSDQVCEESPGTAEIKNIPDECSEDELNVEWSTEEGVKLVKGEGDQQQDVEEDTDLPLKEYKRVGVVPDGTGGKQDVTVEAEVKGGGESCEDCGRADDTTDVGCSLDVKADKTDVKIGETATLTISYNGCGNSSSTDSCTMDVSGSGQKADGDDMNQDTDFDIGTSSIIFSGGKDKETIEVTGYREGTVTVEVGGGSGSCSCGSKSKQIEITKKDENTSGSEIKIKLETKSDEQNEQGIDYLCSAKPGEFELNRYCWGENNKTNANVTVSVEGGKQVDKLEGGPEEFTLACGDTRTGELNVTNLEQEEEENRRKFPRLKAASSDSGEDKTDQYDPDLCRVKLSGGNNMNPDKPVCPDDERTFRAKSICKKDGCADGVEWSYPGGLTKQAGGTGTNRLMLKNESNRPVGGSVSAEVNQADEPGCRGCKSDQVSLGSAIRKGNYEVENDVDNPIEPFFGVDGTGLQPGYFGFELRNKAEQGFLDVSSDFEEDPQITSIEITNLSVSLVGIGNRFPWIKKTTIESSTKPTIHKVSIAGETFVVDDNINDGKPVTIASGILDHSTLTIEGIDDFQINDTLLVEVRSPLDRVEVFAGVGIRVNYKDRCGTSQSYEFSKRFRGIGQYKGLEVKRIPEIVFADSDYWMPLKVELPEFVSDSHAQSYVEEVRVSLRDEEELEMRTISQVTSDSSDLDDGLSWGFGDGTTSQGKFQKIENESEQILDGRRVMTVFVDLDRLLPMNSLKETEDSRPVHMIAKDGPLRMPHFNVHVSLNHDLSLVSTSKFASLEPEKGRPDLIADRRIGPVIDGEKGPQDVDWITQEAESQGYLAPIVYQEVKLKHDDGEQEYSLSSGTGDGNNLLTHIELLQSMPEESDMKAEYDEGLAWVEDYTSRDTSTDADLELTTNLAEVTSDVGFTGEKGASTATLTNGALFYLSYGKNDNIYQGIDEVSVMDLEDETVDVEINEEPFEGGRLALGRKSFDESLTVDVSVSVAAFASGAAITYLTSGAAWVYTGTALSAGSTTYGILSALDSESNAANETRVEFDARLFTPEQYSRQFTEEKRLDELTEPIELGWNVDAHPPASEDLDSGKIVWQLTGDTYTFSDVRFPENSGEFFLDSSFSTTDRKVGQRIDFRFHARMESSMKNELIDDIQVVSKIWYDHPDRVPLRNIEVEPVNE